MDKTQEAKVISINRYDFEEALAIIRGDSHEDPTLAHLLAIYRRLVGAEKANRDALQALVETRQKIEEAKRCL